VRRDPPAALSIFRVPNALTAAADAAAGFFAASAATGSPGAGRVAAVLGASVLLYAGGVALNDVADARADRVHRPERPVPSGALSLAAAAALAAAALASGLALAAAAGAAPFRASLVLLAAILAYDLALKRFGFLGALALGACRALNMGMGAALATGEAPAWPSAVAAAFGSYVVALALVGLGEERGLPSVSFRAGVAAMVLLAAAAATRGPSPVLGLAALVPFIAPVGLKAVRPGLMRASPGDVRALVRDGVLAIPGIDCAILVAHARFGAAAAVFVLFLAARILARRLPVS